MLWMALKTKPPPGANRSMRALREAKASADVMAPSKTPQTPGEENKTDRPDCRPLAFYDEKGMLKTSGRPDGRGGGRPPSDTAAGPGGGRQAARQSSQSKSFLLQHGVAEPTGLAHWSKESVERLRQLPLVAPPVQGRVA